MSQSVFQPVGQKRLTNIAVVRYKKHGKRFEIACYKNKVLNWRNGIERDVDEVLQSMAVFSNVSKGILAKKEDLVEVFGTSDQEQVCLKILAEGELQVSDKERKLELESLFRDVASVISEKCINPETSRPYTISMLERALRDVHFSVDAKRTAKAQALEALPLLQQRFPIQRAQMRLKLTVPLPAKDELQDLLTRHGAVVEERDLGGDGLHLVTVCLVEPGIFRELHSYVQGCTGRVEVLALSAAPAEGEALAASASRSEGIAQAAGSAATPQQQQQQQQQRSAGVLPATVEQPAGAHVQSSLAAAAAAPALKRAQQQRGEGGAHVVYARGPIAGLPEELAARRERFAELDTLQPGWTVELSSRGEAEGGPLDAVFFSPGGERVGTYAAARRLALAASKAAPTAAA